MNEGGNKLGCFKARISQDSDYAVKGLLLNKVARTWIEGLSSVTVQGRKPLQMHRKLQTAAQSKRTKRFGGILTAELANSRAALGGEFLTEACKSFRVWFL